MFLNETCIIKPIYSKANPELGHCILHYLMRIFYKLWQHSGARKVVLFPQGVVGFPNASQKNLRKFFHERLGLLDEMAGSHNRYVSKKFQTGHPFIVFECLQDCWSNAQELTNLQDHQDLVDAFISSLEQAVACIEAAGVIHLDLRCATYFTV